MIFENKIKNNTKFIYLILISFYSFFINFYYADFGVFPIDTFLHYDAGYRILKNEFPVKDFWIVTGFLVDFLQAFFFKVFGVSWISYKIHSSIFNLVISIFSFYFFLNLNFSNFKSLIYSICFATLAYTISGTPFVDLHASFFLLLSTFVLISAFKNPEKNYLWFFFILLIFLSFLSKQVPVVYALILQGPIIIYYMYLKKEKLNFRFIISSIFLLPVTFFIILYFLKIDISLFITEYIKYPREIGSGRINIFNISSDSFFNKFKFIIIPIFVCILIETFSYIKKIKPIDRNSLSKYLLVFSLSVSLIVHQLMTKNQMYIYFLLPLLFSILDKNLNSIIKKKMNYISFIILISLVIITFKYHLRFNENRKFHELENVKLNETISATNIHTSLKGNLWINPFYTGLPSEEVSLIRQSVNELDKIKEEVMLITNYLFMDSITKKNMNLPNKAFTLDGTTYPMVDNKISKDYKKFLFSKIKKKNIKKIYFIKHEKLPSRVFTQYMNKNCYKLFENYLFKIYEIKCFD